MKMRLLLVIGLLNISMIAQDAAMFRSNPEHIGVYNSGVVSGAPHVKWKFATKAAVYSSPAVLGGMVYFGSNDHNVYAVSRDTGTLRWAFKTGSKVSSSPAVAGGMVYFVSYDGNFYAVDAATGKEKWKFSTGGERRFAGKHLHGALPAGETMPDPYDFYLSSPAVADGVVYFGSGDGNIYALNAGNGSPKWKFATGDVVHASPAVANGVVYVGSWDSNFYAIDAQTGKEKWRFKTGEDKEIYNQVGIQSSAVVAEGTVYFGCRDSNLYALDAMTGQKRWAFNNKGSWVITSPAADNGKVYFATSDSGMFYIVDSKTGEQAYSHKFFWPMFSSPAIAGNMVYIGSNLGRVFAMKLPGGELAWTFETEASRQNAAKFSKPDGSTDYEKAFDDFFYDDMVVGVQKLMSVGAVLSSPVLADGVIYVGSADGNLYALQ